MKLTKKLTTVTGAAALAVSALATPLVAQAELSGNVGVYSAYVLRGITNSMENDGTTVQGGIDWSHDSGFYLGYWGSNLGYTTTATVADLTTGDVGQEPLVIAKGTGAVIACESVGDCPAAGFENDFYLGYAGSLGSVDYDIGLIQYYYIGVEESNGLEIPFSVSFSGATLGLKYLTNDVWWGNAGDIYWTLGYDFSLPKDFTLSALVGYYTYQKDGDYIPEVPEAKSSAFRHLDLSLSHPIGDTGADMSITAIIGGEDRFGNDQANTVVLGVSYGFDVK
ncbi:TorF family putative porin [Kaarinaea lacus]